MIDSETNFKFNADSYMYETAKSGVYWVTYFPECVFGETTEVIREEKLFDTPEEARLWAASKGIAFIPDYDPLAPGSGC